MGEIQFGSPDLGQRLRRARERAGIRRLVAAKRLSVPESTLAYVECGRAGLHYDELEILADLYGQPIDELLGIPVAEQVTR